MSSRVLVVSEYLASIVASKPGRLNRNITVTDLVHITKEIIDSFPLYDILIFDKNFSGINLKLFNDYLGRPSSPGKGMPPPLFRPFFEVPRPKTIIIIDGPSNPVDITSEDSTPNHHVAAHSFVFLLAESTEKTASKRISAMLIPVLDKKLIYGIPLACVEAIEKRGKVRFINYFLNVFPYRDLLRRIFEMKPMLHTVYGENELAAALKNNMGLTPAIVNEHLSYPAVLIRYKKANIICVPEIRLTPAALNSAYPDICNSVRYADAPLLPPIPSRTLHFAASQTGTPISPPRPRPVFSISRLKHVRFCDTALPYVPRERLYYWRKRREKNLKRSTVIPVFCGEKHWKVAETLQSKGDWMKWWDLHNRAFQPTSLLDRENAVIIHKKTSKRTPWFKNYTKGYNRLYELACNLQDGLATVIENRTMAKRIVNIKPQTKGYIISKLGRLKVSCISRSFKILQ